MLDVGEEEAVSPRIDAFNSNTGAPDTIDSGIGCGAVVFMGRVNSHLDRVAAECDQVVVCSSLLVDVRNKAVGRIGVLATYQYQPALRNQEFHIHHRS